MSAAVRTGRWLKEALFENLALKVLALAVSIAFYAFHHGAQNAQRTFSVSVVALLPKEEQNRALVTILPANVRVTLHGSRSVLDDTKADDLGTVQLDLRKGTETAATFDASRLKLPPGVSAVIDPPGIEVAWDTVVTRAVPVQLSVTGQPAAGFAVQGQPQAEPRMVNARGPKGLLETMQHARAEPFDVGGLTEGTYPRKIAIDAPPSRVTFDVSTTTVTVQIDRARQERVFVKVPVQVVGVSRGTAVPTEVDVRVSGPPGIVGALRTEQIVPTIDLRAAGVDVTKPGSTSLPAAIAIEGCVTQVVPPSIVVKW